MKKLILSAVLVLGSLASFASTPILSSNILISAVQEEYTEITTDQLPEKVQTALKTTYPDATIDKAYVNEKKEYKIEITVGDQKAAVFADADGNWIKK
jgi:predicted peptidase